MFYFITILILFITQVSCTCVYNTLYDRGISPTEAPGSVYKKPFGLVLRNNNKNINTEQKCIDMCDSKQWCIATADLDGDELVGGFCQFITDWNLLEMEKTNKCTPQLNTNHCELNKNTLLNIDGDVFGIVDIENTHGGRVTEHIVPSNIVPDDIGLNHFCHIRKTDDQVLSKENNVFSDYYTTPPIALGAWADNMDIGNDVTKSMGDPNPFVRRGTSLAHGGFPINSMSVYNYSPYDGAHDFEKYTMFRHGFQEHKECIINAPGSNKKYVSYEELEDGESFFHFITTREDGTNKRYLSCTVNNDDNAFACSWVVTPTLLWRIASFRKADTSDNNQKGGYDRVFLAYDINNPSVEVGWLDRSHADSMFEENKDQMRLLHGGKKNGEGIHKGVGNWKLSRGDSNKDNLPHMGKGSWLSRRNHYRQFAENDNVFANVREPPNQEGSARLCGIHVAEFGDSKTCPNSHRINKFEIEAVPLAKDVGKLFSIQHGGLMVYCDWVVPDNGCTWVTEDDSTRQYFKHVVSGTSQSTVTPVDEVTPRHDQIAIYENKNGFLIFVGYIRLQTFGLAGEHLGVAFSNTQYDTFNFKITETNTIEFGTGFRLKAGETEGGFVTAILDALAGTPPNMTSITVDAITSDDKFHWIKDPTTNDTYHMHMCPDGEYLHQVRCKTDQHCNNVDIACVKPRTNCHINIGGNITVVSLKQAQFVSCPGTGVVVGRNNTHMSCKDLHIIPQIPPGHIARNFPSIGFMTENNVNGTQRQMGSNFWLGVPYQAITPHVVPENKENMYKLWSYGQTCFRDYDESNLKAFDKNAIQQVDQHGAIHGKKCEEPDQFISSITCMNEKDSDCRRGLLFTCDTADNCQMNGEETKVRTPTGGKGEICPFGTVLTGISCMSEDVRTEDGKFLLPCIEMELTCQGITVVPGYKPDKPSDPDDPDEKKASTTIIIGLAVGLPLLIVLGIVCLCCLPDDAIITPEHAPIEESASIRDYEAVPNLRRRNRF